MNRHTAFAIIFSFIVPGLGQIYNQDLTKGFLFILGSLAAILFFGVAYLILWPWAIIDAYIRARALSARPG